MEVGINWCLMAKYSLYECRMIFIGDEIMKDKFLCVMAQFDIETEQKLKELQQILKDNGFVGKQTPNLPNHITLGSFDISQEALIIEKIKMVA